MNPVLSGHPVAHAAVLGVAPFLCKGSLNYPGDNMISRLRLAVFSSRHPVTGTLAMALAVAVLLGACAQSDESGETTTGGEAEEAVVLNIVSPQMGETVAGPSVAIEFDLQNYDVYYDSTTGMGQHIHVILDNKPYIPHYSTEPFVFEFLESGTHTIRAFPSREWHESIKEPDAFAMVTFHVGEADGANSPEPGAPILTYSRPKGEYTGEQADKILVDYWVQNCELSAQDYRVRLRIDGHAQEFIKWEPYWVEEMGPGEHTISLELIGPDGAPVEGPFNRTERVITLNP